MACYVTVYFKTDPVLPSRPSVTELNRIKDCQPSRQRLGNRGTGTHAPVE